MLGITLANLRAHKGRLLLSSLAIVLATAFVAGTFVFTDAMRSALLNGATEDLGASDVVVTAPDDADVPEEVRTTVREVDGVAGVERRVTWQAALRSAGGQLDPANVVSVTPDTGVDWPEVVQGGLPNKPGEAVLDLATAEAKGVDVGDTVSVPRNWEGPDSAGDNKELHVVGLVRVGDSPSFAGTPFVGVTGEQVQKLTDDSGPGMILAVARDGISAAELASEVDSAVAGQYQVRTAEEHASQQTSSGGTVGVTTGLLGFAGIALFVAAIVIANTFSVLLARRTREMALLRCVGATRGQVFRSVLAESALLGLTASAMGVLTGFGLAYGAGAVLDTTSVDIPFGAVTLSATAVLVPVVVGVAVTMGAALLPARAATRVPPVAALRDQAVPTARRRRGRVVLAALALLAGATGLVLGTLVLPREHGFVVAFSGEALTFLGVLLAGPTLIPPLVRLMGAVSGRILGTPGRLAAANVVRDPRRSTATVSALLVGMTLISLMSVGAESVRTTVTSEVNEKFPVDFMIRSESGMPDVVADNVSAIRGLSDVTTVRGATTDVQGSEIWVSGYNPQQLAEVTSEFPKISRIDQGEVVLTEELAHRLAAGPGDTLRLGGDGADSTELTVSAILPATGGQQPGAAYTTQPDLARVLPEAPIAGVFARAAPGADLTQVSYAIDSATAGNEVTVVGTAETRAVYTETLDMVLLMFSALLGIALIIAVVGIANTMALSVIERTRESALLRALGLTRGQLRATLAVEAGLLAVVGALLGAGLGTVFGWAGITTMLGSDFEVVLAVPEMRLAGFIVGAVFAGVLASVLPARRAARASVVSALSDE